MGVTLYDSDNNVIEYLTQWDVNRVIKIDGLELPYAPSIHFYNRLSKSAYVVPTQMSDGIIVANIPNILLQEAVSIIADVYTQTTSGGEGKTVYSASMVVRARAKPGNYEYIENIEYIDFAELQSKVEYIEDWIEGFGTDTLEVASISELSTYLN